MLLFLFYTPWKQKIIGVLMFSGSKKWVKGILPARHAWMTTLVASSKSEFATPSHIFHCSGFIFLHYYLKNLQTAPFIQDYRIVWNFIWGYVFLFGITVFIFICSSNTPLKIFFPRGIFQKKNGEFQAIPRKQKQ